MKQVIDIENIKMVGKNKKYTKNHKLTTEYRVFKETVNLCCKKFKGNPPYKVFMEFKMYHDIDAPISAVLDGMQLRAFGNDRDVHELQVKKVPGKRGKEGSIKVWIGEVINERA